MTAIGIRHTAIVVGDMDTVLPFYRDLLGMEVWADFKDSSDYVRTITAVEGANIWTVNLKLNDEATIQLQQYISHGQEPCIPRRGFDRGLNHIAIEVEDIDAAYDKMRKAGVCFHAPPTVSTDGFAKVTYCHDPEGVSIELVQILSPSIS